MAVTVNEESLYHATEALILKSPRKYYRVSMLAPHWQLRSIISSPSPNIVHYSNRDGICQLDTTTCEREIVARVSFAPRCLVAAEEWICCGGDAGDFATIHLESRDPEATGLEADADSRLPLDLDTNRRSYSMERSDQVFIGLRNRTFKAPVVKSTNIGHEIVNCVTLWFPKPDLKDQTYEKPVAVLSNNDHSVAIVDLEGFEVLETLKLDDCVNRAVISPDSQLLIAIGDDPYMHVYHRKLQAGTHKSTSGPKSLKAEWIKCQRVQLQGQRLSDKSDMRGSFAAAFSPSGRYLAVGTQYGIISVFDTGCLTTPGDDPLVLTFTTSRPNQRAGAVRALEFSPEPFDLLAWTENNGRAGVADIRRCFMSRQILIMDPSADGVDRVGVIERSDDLVIDPRLRQSRTDLDSNSSDSLNAQEGRQLRHFERELHSLNPDELASLDAFQADRRQRDAARQAMAGAAQNGSSSSTDPPDMRSLFGRESIGSRRNQTIILPSSLRELISGRASEALRSESLRAYFNERNQERDRRGQQPRRRGSVAIATAQSALDRDLVDSQRGTAGDLATGSNRVTLTPPRLPAGGSDSPHNPWAEIEALYNPDPPVDPTSRMRIELEMDSRRDNARRLERHILPFTARIEYDEETGRATVRSPDLGPATIEPLDTTGCCWSRDGKILYIGAENGIYEYHVDTTGRKFFPSLVLQ